ncbi:MAG: hypothetical protein QF464_17185, partial [Myxococcota bacterium]|nr:hypothetical protein [Myxococcota bacterium]
MTSLSAVAAALMCTLGSSPTPVLGVDAAAPLLAWVKSLGGLDVRAVPIAHDRARVELQSGDCVLLLAHRTASICEDGIALGDTLGCWRGEGCPSDKVRAHALASAGELVLPWRVPAGDHMADGGVRADAGRKALMAARQRAQERLDVMDRDGARKALLPMLGRGDLGPADLVSVLPVLVRVGAGREAMEVTRQPGWTVLPVGLRVLVH